MSILISIYYVGSFIRENAVIVSRAINCEIPCTHVTRFVHAYVAQHPLLRRGVSLCMPNRANLSGFDGRYQRYVTRWLRDRRCKPNTSPLSRFGYSLSLSFTTLADTVGRATNARKAIFLSHCMRCMSVISLMTSTFTR